MLDFYPYRRHRGEGSDLSAVWGAHEAPRASPAKIPQHSSNPAGDSD